jgi:hypothetical protein
MEMTLDFFVKKDSSSSRSKINELIIIPESCEFKFELDKVKELETVEIHMVRLLKWYFIGRIDYPVLIELALNKYPFSLLTEKDKKVSLNLDNAEDFKAMKAMFNVKDL